VNRRIASLALAASSLLLLAQAKPVLVPDISSRSVEIRYSFSGAQLLLFGAILYPRGRAPERPADIVVVLRGPVQPIVLREKQKLAGIWMNADSICGAARASTPNIPTGSRSMPACSTGRRSRSPARCRSEATPPRPS
jgi:hypothetical protein